MRARFRDLDSYLRDVMLSAREELLLVSPYLGPTGMVVMRGPLAAAAERGVWIRILTGGLEDSGAMNRNALDVLLEGEDGAAIKQRLRILAGSAALPMLIHAKIVVADRKMGYLGSANLSARGLQENLEVGTALLPAQARALADFVTYLESQGLIVDRTDLLDLIRDPTR